MICVDEVRDLKDDNIMADPTNRHIFKGCYLYTDNGKLEELHTFARSIGLTTNNYKTDNFLPRYMITIEKRNQAISKGASQSSFRKTVEVCRKNKSKSAYAAWDKRKDKVKNEK